MNALLSQPVPGEVLIGIGILLAFIGPRLQIKNNSRIVGSLLAVGGIWLFVSIAGAVGGL